MKDVSPTDDGKNARIVELIATLRAAESELQELTGGHIDAVLVGGGQPLLLAEAQKRLHESEGASREFAETRSAILNAIPARIALLDADGIVIAVNERWEQGVRDVLEECHCDVGASYLECVGRASFCKAAELAGGIRAVLAGERSVFSQEYPAGPEETDQWFQVTVSRWQRGAQSGAVVIHMDISERKDSERRLAGLNRLYQMLSRTNEAILRARSQPGLFADVCRLGVAIGNFPMVAVVLLDYEKKLVNPVEFSGSEEGYFIEIGTTVADDTGSDGLFGQLARAEQPLIFNDIAAEAQSERVREASIKRGFEAMAAFPLRVDGAHPGSLVFFSDEAGYFDTEEVTLLGNMAEEVSFALEALGNQAKRDAVEQALAESQRRLSAILYSAGEGIHGLNLQGNIVFENAAGAAMFGWEPEEMIGKHSHELIHHHRADGSVYPVDKCPIYRTLRDGVTRSVKNEVFFRRDGTSFPVEYVCAPMRDDSGALAGAVVNFRDVSDQLAAEEALRTSQDQFSSAFEHAAIGIALVSPVGRFLRVNRSLCLMLGRSADELLECNFQSITHPDDLKVDLEQVRRLLAGETDFYEIEKRYLHKDGHLVWASLSVSLVRDSAGQPVHFVSQIQDVTVRRDAQEERDRLFNLSVDMLGVANFDGHFEQVNPAWTECLGWSKEELTTQPWVEFVHPDDIAATEAAGERLVGGEMLRFFENRYRCKDGSYRWISWSCHALPEARQIFAVARDVTERRDREEELLLLKNCVARLNDGLLITEGHPLEEPYPRIVFANAAMQEISGYEPSELVGRSPRVLQGPKTDRGELHRIREALRHARPVNVELVNYHKDGSDYWVEVSISPVFNAVGELTHFVAVQRDITERKEAEAERERNQAMLRVAGETARLGGWTLELPAQNVVWSDETCAIHDVPPGHEPSFEEALAFYCKDERERVAELVNRCLSVGEPFDCEAQVRTARGRMIWVRTIGEAVRSPEGEIVRLQGAFQDVSALKEIERSLQASEARFRELAESMPMIVWSAAADGEVDYSNHHFFEFTGAGREEPAATRWQAFVHPDDLESCLEAWRRSIKREAPFDIEYRLQRQSDGRYRWFRVQALPVRNADGRITKWYGTALDIHETKRIQEEATQLATRLVTTLESITDAFFTFDRSWRVTYLNAEAERILKRKRSELLGANLWDEFPEAVGTPFELHYRRALRENVTVAFEEYYPPLNCWLEVRAYPSSEGLAVYFQDVSEQHESGEALRASEERFRLLARATNDAIWDWNIETNALIWSEGFERLFGYDRKKVDPTRQSWTENIHPDDVARVNANLSAALESNRQEWTGEYRFRRRDGSYAHVIDRGYIIRDSDGYAGRMVGGLSDQTERKSYEERIAEQAALLDIAHEAILVRDLEGKIIFWNKGAELTFGWTAAEAVGERAADLLYAGEGRLEAAGAKLLATGGWQGELHGRSKAGLELILEEKWTLVRDPGGRPKSVLTIGTDVTERKRLEQQFLRAQRMESIGTLAGGIAHDLNNLLSPILMGVSLLKLSESGGERAGVLDTIEQSARRGTDLVKQVLSFARGIEGARITTALDEVVAEVATIVVNTFPKNIRFEREVTPGIWPTRCDPTQINQVVLNLCVNARDSMPEGGTLKIALSNIDATDELLLENDEATSGRFVRLSVSDTGCGMSKEVLDRIFEPFFTTKELGQGTGLGLSTVLGIVRSHGGFVKVSSETGEGTTFRVYLPAEEKTSSGAMRSDRPALPRGNGEMVLVVDDEESILEITKQTLKAFGYRVVVAEDGARAVGVYASHRNDIKVVLTDMMMPGMDGPALIAMLRKMNPEVKVIASSGLSTSVDASGSGITHFLEKPFSSDRLLCLLKEVLAEESAANGR